MKNLQAKLNTIADLEKNIMICMDDYDLKRREKQHSANIRSLNSKMQDLSKRFNNMKNDISESRMLLKKIYSTQANFSSLIENYESIKTLFTAFINMKRTIKYALKIQNVENESEKISLENLRKKDKLRWKLVFYSKDLNKNEYLHIKPIIDQLDKEFNEWECEVLKYADNFFSGKVDDSELEDVLKALNIVHEIDEETYIAKKGRDGSIKEPKKEYFTYTFNDEPFKFPIRDTVIVNNIQDSHILLKKTDNSFCRVFYNENIHLPTRNVSNLKTRFIKNLMHTLAKQDVLDILSDLKKIIHFSEYFSNQTDDNIFHFIHQMLIHKLQKDFDEASEILSIIHFSSSYDKLVRSVNIFFKEELVNLQHLKSMYLTRIKSKLAIWIENITSAEIKQLKERSSIPNKDEEDHFISSNFINLLKIVKETLEPVSFDYDLYNFIVLTIIQDIKHFKDGLIQTLDNEYQKNVTNTTSGFEEYCICIGNSGLKLTQYISSICECEDSSMQQTNTNQSDTGRENNLSDLGQIFLSITQHTNTLLSKYVIFTLKPAIKKLFTRAFYDDHQSILRPIKATLSDFLEDYRETMNEYVFVTFLNDLIDHLRNSYFNQMIKKKSIIYQTLPDYIEKDEKGINRTIAKFCFDENVRIDLNVIKPILTVTSTESFISELQKIKYEIDLKKEFLKSIIKKRTELNSEERRDLNDAINSMYYEQEPKKKKGFFSGYV